MKRLFFYSIVLFCTLSVSAERINLETCQQKARNNYPLLKQFGLIDKTTGYNIENANKSYLPQISLSAKATYQSEVTKLPITIPGVTVPELSQDQYMAALELNQLIWDGGVTQASKKNIKASAEADKQKVEVDLYALRDRVNQLYFGILLLNNQLELNKILQSELESNLNKINAMRIHGLSSGIDVDAIQVEKINAQVREKEIQTARKTYIQLLSAFTAQEITEQVELEKPIMDELKPDIANKRPELVLLEAQQKVLETQKNLITASNLPKVSAFVQGGYGRPGLNMLTNEFSPFYIGGLRLSWNISGFYTQKNNLQKIEIGKKSISTQQETFLFNNKLLTKQQLNEIEKLKSVIVSDNEIIRLRESIRKATETKLQSGTASTTDLLRELNAENAAKQTRILHETQLYSVYYQFLNASNN